MTYDMGGPTQNHTVILRCHINMTYGISGSFLPPLIPPPPCDVKPNSFKFSIVFIEFQDLGSIRGRSGDQYQ